MLEQLGADAFGHPAVIRNSVSVSSSAAAMPRRADSSEKTSAFGRASPCGSMTGRTSCRRDRPIAFRDVVLLEERGRGQDDVRVACGVGDHLLEDDRKQILALQPLQHAVLIRDRCQRVAVVDEQHLHRRIGVSSSARPS